MTSRYSASPSVYDYYLPVGDNRALDLSWAMQGGLSGSAGLWRRRQAGLRSSQQMAGSGKQAQVWDREDSPLNRGGAQTGRWSSSVTEGGG